MSTRVFVSPLMDGATSGGATGMRQARGTGKAEASV
jgi:hypothetical protein